MLPTLYIVVPCFNEQEVLPQTAPVFSEKIRFLQENGKVSNQSKVLFVNDGSKDNTWQIIKNLSENDNIFCGMSLSRNRGHQNALLAGLLEAKEKCDVAVSIDCDGQDDINAIDEMIACYLSGYEIVYGIRDDRSTDTAFKRNTAEGFYKFLKLMGAEVVYNHADYRLMSKRALNALSEFKEVNLYLRGMVTMVGFKSTSVYYKRSERIAGKSHYPLSKMIGLAANGVTSLSVKPIRIISFFGAVVSLIGFIGLIVSLVAAICKNAPQWSTVIIALITFFGGLQLLATGIIGEYIGKIHLETQNRPRFIIEERTKNL